MHYLIDFFLRCVAHRSSPIAWHIAITKIYIFIDKSLQVKWDECQHFLFCRRTQVAGEQKMETK